MELSEARAGRDVPVLRVSGEVDLASAAELQASAEALLARRPGLVVLDLSDVTFFDSAGLKVLDDLQQHADDSGARIALVGPQPRIVRLLEITGLTDRFTIHATVAGAAATEADGD